MKTTLDRSLDREHREDAIEKALAQALSQAALSGRFDVVAQLARELEARRLSRSTNVVAINAHKKAGGRRDR
jgi:hypothetical protein